MNTYTLCRWQEIDAPPAHLKQDERENEPREEEILMLARRTEMQVEQVAEPGGKRPSLLRVPTPIVAPCFLRPQGAHGHAQGEETPPHSDQSVADAEFLVGSLVGALAEPQVDGKQGDRAHHGIREHIDDDMRHEPHALKGGHQGLAMDFGLQEIDKYKDQ